MTETQDVHPLIKVVVSSGRNSLKVISNRNEGWTSTCVAAEKNLCSSSSSCQKNVCCSLHCIFMYLKLALVYMFLLQKINNVFEEVKILPHVLLLLLKILSVPTSTDLRWAKVLAKESLKKFIGFHLCPRQVLIFCL